MRQLSEDSPMKEPTVTFKPHFNRGMSTEEMAECLRLMIEALDFQFHVPLNPRTDRYIQLLRKNPQFTEVKDEKD